MVSPDIGATKCQLEDNRNSSIFFSLERSQLKTYGPISSNHQSMPVNYQYKRNPKHLHITTVFARCR
jgi:hypothetical protein